MSKIEVSGLSIYPVKSLSGIQLETSRVEPMGLRYDRRWMLVDSNNRFITQRQQARMCLIVTALSHQRLQLTAPGMTAMKVDMHALLSSTLSKTKVEVWRDECEAYDCGDDAASWLSQFLDVECRLMYFPDDSLRRLDPDYATANDKTAFSDGFPFLLTTEASLADLNGRMEQSISMRRFRPNIVLKGCSAFDEDNWRLIRIGEVTFRVAKPCSRCGIPNLDPETAQQGQEPSRTLISYRRQDGKILFGQNLIADNPGEIKLGLPVEILETK